MQDTDERANSRRTALISGVGNFSIQYNFNVVAIVLAMMGAKDITGNPAFDITTGQSAVITSIVLAGAVIGMLTMGFAGDRFGRGKAMVITNCLTALGALGCALFAWKPFVFSAISACRFILGIGVGGKYPLTAMMRAEGTAKGEHGATEVSKGFFWQTPGSIAPYLMALIIYTAAGQGSGMKNYESVNTQIRLLFAIGAIPSLYVAWLCMGIPESEAFKHSKKGQSSNPISVACQHKEYLFRLIGTGGCWFLYDFSIYGVFLNSPVILKKVFGNSETIVDICWQNIVVALGGVVGILIAISMVRCLGLKALQNYGFLAMTLCALFLAAAVKFAPNEKELIFGLFVLDMVALNWGVNLSTYALPTEVYPPEVRGTFFGLSAALGKLGGFLGALLFPIMVKHVGLSGGFLISAAMSMLGMGFTHAFIAPYWRGSCSSDDTETRKASQPRRTSRTLSDALELPLIDEADSRR